MVKKVNMVLTTIKISDEMQKNANRYGVNVSYYARLAVGCAIDKAIECENAIKNKVVCDE